MPKFKFKAKVDKLDEVAEAYRDAYVERDGAFHLDPLKLEGIEFDDKAELDGAIRKEREARSRIENDLKAEREKFKDVDPEKYAELLAKEQETADNELKSKGKIDELLLNQRNTLEKKFADEKKKLEDTISQLNADLDRVTIDGALRAAFEKAGVMADRIDDAVDLTKPKAKREEGKLVLYDADNLKLDVSLETYAKEILKEQKPWLYAASGNGGSGAQNGTHGGNGKKIIKRSDLDKMMPTSASAAMKEVREGKAELVDQ